MRLLLEHFSEDIAVHVQSLVVQVFCVLLVSVFCFLFSVFCFPFSVFRFPFSVFRFPFSVFRFLFSVFCFPFSVFCFLFSDFCFGFWLLAFGFWLLAWLYCCSAVLLFVIVDVDLYIFSLLAYLVASQKARARTPLVNNHILPQFENWF